MEFKDIDDICLNKYNSVKDIFTKSKTIIMQYLSIVSGIFTVYGQQLINIFNDNSSQVQVILDPKYFALISIICGILTTYFKYQKEKTILNEVKNDNKQE